MHLACEVAATVPSCPELFDPQHRRFGPTVCNHKQSVRDDQSSVAVCMLYKPHATAGLLVYLQLAIHRYERRRERHQPTGEMMLVGEAAEVEG